MRELDEIIVHCSATRPDWMAGQGLAEKVAEIRRWHVDGNGWSDIGYHLIIDRDGQTAEGRAVSRSGAHVKGRNAKSIGICMLGGHGSSKTDSPEDHFTPEQLAALALKIRELQAQYGISKVSGHNQYANKACPGFNVPRWMDGAAPARSSPARSSTLQAIAGGGTAGAVGVFTAIGQLDPVAQAIVALCAVMAAGALAWVARERLRKWAAGDV